MSLNAFIQETTARLVQRFTKNEDIHDQWNRTKEINKYRQIMTCYRAAVKKWISTTDFIHHGIIREPYRGKICSVQSKTCVKDRIERQTILSWQNSPPHTISCRKSDLENTETFPGTKARHAHKRESEKDKRAADKRKEKVANPIHRLQTEKMQRHWGPDPWLLAPTQQQLMDMKHQFDPFSASSCPCL